MSIFLPFEKCPCGSGKRYINCCFELNHQYCKISLPKSLNQTITTKKKYYIIDKTLYQEYLEMIFGFLDFHMDKDYNLCLKDYPNLLYYIDKLSNLFLISTDCHKGCDGCCYMPVAVTEFEADYIKQHITQNWTPKQKSDLHSKIQKIKQEHKEIFEFDYIISKNNKSTFLPCLFLENGCCSIYPYRPAICRTYMSFSPSEICKEVQLNLNKDVKILEADSANDFRAALYDFYFSHAKMIYRHQHLAYWFSCF